MLPRSVVAESPRDVTSQRVCGACDLRSPRDCVRARPRGPQQAQAFQLLRWPLRQRKPQPAKRGPNDGRSIPTSPIVTPLLTTADVCALLRVSRQTLWELRKRAGFPMAIVLNNSVGTGSPRWRREEVEAFLESRRADCVSA